MPDYITYSQTPPVGYATIRTHGKRPAKRMLHDEKIVKKRLDNPVLWRQLEAISNGTWVNHLGRGHARTLPVTSENEWELRRKIAEHNCDACVYGNDAVYLHTCCTQCRQGNPHVHLG